MIENEEEESRAAALRKGFHANNVPYHRLDQATTKSSEEYAPSPSPSKLLEFPHACVTLSDIATWGSPTSVATDTDVPSTSDELSGEESEEAEVEFDDDFVVHGGPDVLVGDSFPIERSFIHL